MELPLKGVVVLDLSRVLAGPLSTMVLGDLGADVIKVEHPERGDDTRDWGIPVAPKDTSYYFSFNRNKRSIAIDLMSAAGRETARALSAKADVVVENFKAGGMEKFGLGYEALRRINPRLIYCAISGYDREGPEASRPGYDLVIQGESGIMSINGEAGQQPLKFGIAAVDMFTGMYAAQAILAALFERQRTDAGRRIDLALYDCGVMISSYYGLEALLEGRDAPRYGNAHPSIVPYGVFDSRDGPLVIAVGTNRQFRSLCDVLGRADLGDDARFATNLLRSKNRIGLLEILRPLLAARTRVELLAGLAKAGIPCGEVLGMHEALTGDRSKAAGLISEHPHPVAGRIPIYNPPWRFDGKRPPVRRPPMLGEQSEDILALLDGKP
jgi:crotonobetainyl-CoA:carnitine CoA-transferase CaiB-like acyl-CoA transferase